MAEDDRVGVLEARAHPREPPRPLTGVVDHRDPGARRLDHPGRGQHAAQRVVVDVAVDPVDRRPERLERPQHLEAHEVARVQDRVGGAAARPRRRPAGAACRGACGCRRRSRCACPNAKLPAAPGARSSVDRALPSGGRSRRFESCRARASGRPLPSGVRRSVAERGRPQRVPELWIASPPAAALGAPWRRGGDGRPSVPRVPHLDAGLLLPGGHEGARPPPDGRARGDPERLRGPGRRGDGGADRLPPGRARARPRRGGRLPRPPCGGCRARLRRTSRPRPPAGSSPRRPRRPRCRGRRGSGCPRRAGRR